MVLCSSELPCPLPFLLLDSVLSLWRLSCCEPALEKKCQINDLNWLKVQQGAQQDAKCFSQVGTYAKRWSRVDLNDANALDCLAQAVRIAKELIFS